MQKMFQKKHIVLIIAVFFVFIFSFAVRFYPILHKGYPPNIRADSLLLARNLSLSNEYKIESEKGVILSSSLLKERGAITNSGNELSNVLYAKVFDVFGFSPDIPVYVSLVLWALTTALLFLIILRLFNIWLALIFVLVDIFAPIVLASSIRPGSYEWAALFFTIALLFYLWNLNKGKFRYTKLFFAGSFFGLATLAGNAYLISLVPFLVYEFFRNKSFKRVLIFVLPFILVWGIYLGPGFIKEGAFNNYYLTSAKTSSSEYMHIFPDPYTYHFEREEYIGTVLDTRTPDFIKALTFYNYDVSFSQRLWLYWTSAIFYIQEFFRLTNIGGALTILFFFLGIGYLYKKKNRLLLLFGIWIGIWYFALVFYGSSSNHHLAEIRFPIFFLVSLGVYWIIQFILGLNTKKKFKYLLILALLFFIFLDLTQSDKWLLHEKYENTNMEEILSTAEILKQADIVKEDIIAVGFPNETPLTLNYYTNLNLVYFHPDTIKKLLDENKLQWAFEQFEITKIVAYDRDLTAGILEATNVENIE